MKTGSNQWLFVLCVLGVAFLHFIATFVLAFISGTTGGKAIKIATQVLTFPLSMVESGPDNALIGWGAWILLSLGWGLSFCIIVRVFLNAIKSR